MEALETTEITGSFATRMGEESLQRSDHLSLITPEWGVWCDGAKRMALYNIFAYSSVSLKNSERLQLGNLMKWLVFTFLIDLW